MLTIPSQQPCCVGYADADHDPPSRPEPWSGCVLIPSPCGEPRRLVISAPTPLRQDFDAPEVR
jgi:hypothetical protein